MSRFHRYLPAADFNRARGLRSEGLSYAAIAIAMGYGSGAWWWRKLGGRTLPPGVPRWAAAVAARAGLTLERYLEIAGLSSEAAGLSSEPDRLSSEAPKP